MNLKLTTKTNGSLLVPINISLFEWVLENLVRNSLDAMNGIGKISIVISHANRMGIIDVSDSGRGIPKSAWKNIFKPGYTTKQRGWGLGLSLARRIVEMYHGGKIFVRHSDPEQGTCIRILLPAAAHQG
ncbi:MAG: HAMP domain-containing sensor histidine kinase [Bacteroidales bacterium]